MEAHKDQQAASPGDHNSGYEKLDIHLGTLLLVTLGSIIFIVVSIVVINDWFTLEKDELVYEKVLKPESISLRDLRSREDQVLNSYRVIDPAKGIYQIPIDRAMEVLAEESYRTQSAGQPR